MIENLTTVGLEKYVCYKIKPLSQREKEVLFLIANEYNSSRIAKELFLSIHTVISHRQRLMEKLGASNSAGLVRRGFELGILRVDDSIEKGLHEEIDSCFF